VFGDVETRDKFIVQTWHRGARIENGKVLKVVYGHSYPAFPPARVDPELEEFYRALLVFVAYWQTCCAISRRLQSRGMRGSTCRSMPLPKS
jgi:hypothetical protein